MENLNYQIETLITGRTQTLAEKIVEKQYSLQPEFFKPFGTKGRNLSIRDAGYHIPFLVESVLADDPQIISDYVAWVKVLFRGLNFPDEIMIKTLECTDAVFKDELPSEIASVFSVFIEAGIDQMKLPVLMKKSYIDENEPIGKITREYITYLLNGDRKSASSLIVTEIEQGTPIREIYMEVFQKSQYEIGRLWLSNQISVAKEHFCTAATQVIMSQLYPLLFNTERVGHKLVTACVGGELHELGIRMVTDFFEMEGWDTYYLGANTPGSTILKAIDEYEAEVIGLSIAMPYHRSILRNVVHEIKNSDSGKNTIVLVGGNAVNSKYSSWEWFGADGYAPDAISAVRMANSLISA
jgi:methanogenic corrinoid protein MtbC1